jgi:two-component system copper resistance phosphate regulon response regulator CusR
MLELFMLHPGQKPGRAQIAEHVWGENFDPLPNIIDLYVKTLRTKLDDSREPTPIQTRRARATSLRHSPWVLS